MNENQLFDTAQSGEEKSEETAPMVVEQSGELDDLLDEIDELLVSDSQTFVQSFVQKGGQ